MLPRTHWKEFGQDTSFKACGCTHSALVTVLVSSNYLHFFATALLDNRSCVALHCIHLLQYAFTVKKCEVTLVDAVWERSSTRDEPNVGTCQFGLGVFLSIHHLVSCSLGWFRIGWWLLYLALTRAYCSISRRGQNFWQHREGAHRSHQKRNQRWCLQWRRFLQLLPCFYQALTVWSIQTFMCRSRQRQQRQL